jgi:hypothetical protein
MISLFDTPFRFGTFVPGQAGEAAAPMPKKRIPAHPG